MGAPKGRPKPAGSGAKKGVPLRRTLEIKEMIEGALQDAGGRAYLTRQAIENPGPFMALVGKLIPKEIRADIEFGRSLGDILRGLADSGTKTHP